MTSYVPLFQSLTTGTLCGRWPDVGLWPIVLSLADRYGVVDVTPAYLARVTGLALEEVAACMQRFCEPDLYSRSTAERGARLVLVDPEHRNWGWRIVNYSKYAERARKRAYDARRQESGLNAERLKAARRARSDPTQSDVTRDDPLSSQLNSSYKEGPLPQRGLTKDKAGDRSRTRPEDFTLTNERRARILRKLPDADPEPLFEAFTAHHDAKGSKFVRWDRALDTWLTNAPEYGYRRPRSDAATEGSGSQEAPHGRAANGMPYVD